jgi:peptide/nickel transport system permease protein
VIVFTVTAALVFGTSLMGIRITPYDPLEQNIGPPLSPPSWTHIFGTDQLGRDVFSGIIIATPNDFVVGVAVVIVAFVVGILVGSYAGFRGGLIDEALMRITDVFFGLPRVVLAMAIGVALGSGVVNMMIALIVVWWPSYARLARAETLKVAHQNYIDAAKLSALSRVRCMFVHVVPNIFVTILVYGTLDVGNVILAYAGLSYLGLAVKPPQPDWGAMVSGYQDLIMVAPWLPLFPGVIIAVVVVGFSMFGDGVRDILYKANR